LAGYLCATLRAEINGRPLIEYAKEALEISKQGLVERAQTNFENFDESIFLIPLEDTLALGKTPAERMLDKYHNEWKEDISKVFSEYAY